MTENKYEYKLKITENIIKELIDEMGDMPNIPMRTMGGKVFWTTIAEANGYKIQINNLLGNARILDKDNKRVAWGNKTVMKEKFNRLIGNDFLRRGDIIGIRRKGGYEHYAVYIGNHEVIHYAGENSDFSDKRTIHKAPISEFLRNDTVFFVLNFPNEYAVPEKIYNSDSLKALYSDIIRPEGNDINEFKKKEYHLYSPEETVKRAESRIGESEYNLVSNNCEHFAIWCKTGISESHQVNRIINLLSNRKNEILAIPI